MSHDVKPVPTNLVAAKKVSVIEVTRLMFHEAKPVPTNLDAPLNVPCSVKTLSTFHPLRSEFISSAALKVQNRVVTEDVSHDANPVPVNFNAWENVPSNLFTLATFHPLRSEFISEAE